MKSLHSYLYKNMSLFIVTIIFILILGILAPLRSFVFQRIIDSTSMQHLFSYLIIGIIFCIFVFFVEYASKAGLAKLLKEISYDLRKDVFNSIINLNIREFNKNNSAEYISTLSNDLKIINDEYYVPLYEVLLQSSFFIIAAIMISFISPILLLIVFFVSIFPILLPKIFSEKLKNNRGNYSKRMSEYISEIKDVFSGFEVVKTFSIEKKITNIEKEKNSLLSDSEYKSNIVLYLAQTLSSVISNISFILVIAVAMYLVLRGDLTIGFMVATTQMMNFIMTPCRTVSQNIAKIKSTKQIQVKILDLINRSNAFTKENEIEGLKFKIQFKDVSFSIGENRILDKISLTIERGKKYAIVGTSGSGKSTLIKLLLRYYDDYEGSIEIDGIDNRTISNESIFRVCPIIHQNVFVFNDTLKNNIALYNDYSDVEIKEAITAAGIDHLVFKLKNGIYEIIDENGNNFSGGEKQRISIARALIKKPSVIILDEATSSLDNETAYKIEESILKIPYLTSLIITHKYNEGLLKSYDEIIAIKDGKLMEVGTFDELTKRKGYFYSLFSISSEKIKE
ncbi:MAG: ABC transporter ATP-binding protein [Anaerocolumna sp.]